MTKELNRGKLLMSKKYRDRDWLERKWLDEDLSKQEIADICGVEEVTIKKYLNEEFPSLGVYGCDKCEKAFKTERNLKFHSTTVHERGSSQNKYTFGEEKHHEPEWVQKQLEEGKHYDEIAEECPVGSETIRRVIRKNNLGTYHCPQDSCDERYPTEGGLKQHLSREHPENGYDGYGLDLEHVKERNHEVRMESIENEKGQYDPEVRDENLERAREEYDGENHSRFMQKYWEDKDPEDYHQRREGWWEKYAQSRENWGRQTHYNELTGNTLDSKWELEIDTLLHENDIEYENEKQTYSIADTWNTPDFEGDDWIIEVKSFAGFRDDERYEKIGQYFVDETEKKYILISEKQYMPCDVYISWNEREEVISVVE